jgi:hypothetical protein
MPTCGNINSQLITGFLQKSSLAYRNSKFIWNEIYPIVEMPNKNSKVTVWNRGDEFRDEATKRAPGTVTPWNIYETSSVTISTDQWAKKHALTEEEIRDNNSDVLSPALNLQMAVMAKNARGMQLKMEKLVADNVTGATWVDGNSGGEDAAGGWAASSSNTFQDDVFLGIDTLRKNGIGIDMGIGLMMDYTTYRQARRYGGIIDVSKYAGDKATRYPNAQEIADFFSIDKCVVGGGIYSSAEKKADGTDFTAVDIWGGANAKGFGMVFAYPKNIKTGTAAMGLEVQACGVMGFHKMPNGQREQTKKWFNDDAGTWFYEQKAEFGPKQTMSAAAYAWKDTHTT